MHIEPETLRKVLDGTLASADRASADRHLASCAECRERLADLQLFALLGELDDPTPDITPEEVLARAERTRAPTLGRWAASIGLMLATAGAVYAAPGSPVPGWVASLTGGGEAGTSIGEVAPGPQSVSGIVVPAGDRLIIEIDPQSSGAIRFQLVESGDVTVEALNAAATFDSGAERLVVRSSTTPDYRISVPRGAREVAVIVGGLRVFRLADGQVVTLAVPDESGQYAIAFEDVR